VKPVITPPGGISSFLKNPSFAAAGEFVSNNKLPLLLAGGAALIAADRSSSKKQAPSILPSETGTSLLAKYPEKYGVNPESLVPRTVQFGPSTVFPNNRYIGGNTPEFPSVTRYAKAGGHISGPGTGTSDSIPARLSDGEFVMTADAVRGAGNGSRIKGARKMYELMHKFERMA
jgi:hypothetical protein